MLPLVQLRPSSLFVVICLRFYTSKDGNRTGLSSWNALGQIAAKYVNVVAGGSHRFSQASGMDKSGCKTIGGILESKVGRACQALKAVHAEMQLRNQLLSCRPVSPPVVLLPFLALAGSARGQEPADQTPLPSKRVSFFRNRCTIV